MTSAMMIQHDVEIFLQIINARFIEKNMAVFINDIPVKRKRINIYNGILLD